VTTDGLEHVKVETGNREKETQMAVKVAMIGHLSVGVLSLMNPLYESR
jgi:hypothetical protein